MSKVGFTRTLKRSEYWSNLLQSLTLGLLQILPVLLTKLGDEQFESQLVFECLKRTVELMAEYVKGDHTVPLWDALLVSELPTVGQP